MSIHALTRIRLPAGRPWWHYLEIGGATGLVVLAILLVVGYIPHPATMAALLHVAADFTFQSPETARKKKTRDYHLLLHAMAAGGLPLAIAAILTQDPLVVVLWAVMGTVSHYVVDWTRKFGLRRTAPAILLDQACHLLTILLLVLVR
jgi:hypothetical protein